MEFLEMNWILQWKLLKYFENVFPKLLLIVSDTGKSIWITLRDWIWRFTENESHTIVSKAWQAESLGIPRKLGLFFLSRIGSLLLKADYQSKY